MAPRKSERIVNLTICLLSARRFLPKEQIREVVEGYAGLSDAAFERTFERDKEELRAMGVPVETGQNDRFFSDEVGYRVRRQDFELPPVEFTPEEATVLGAAARVWQQAAMAEQTVSALAKLRAAGIEPDTDRLSALEPSVSAREPAFEAIWTAALARRRVEFGYRGGSETRVLEPWSVTFRRGAWYVLGRDLSRGEPRLFKMSRITTEPVVVGEPGAYEVPELDLAELTRRLEPSAPDAEALLAIRGDHAPALRRRGTPCELPAPVPLEGFHGYRVAFANPADLAAEVCSAGADVLVVEPLELRERVLRQLREVAGAVGGGA